MASNESQRTLEGPNISPSAVPRQLQLGEVRGGPAAPIEIDIPTVPRGMTLAQQACELQSKATSL